ncbi:DUF2147 domain-containing protein [soil metagenome]
MSRNARHFALGIGLTVIATLAHAQATPVGVWKTIDDETKKEKSLVHITEAGSALTGKVEKFLDPASKPDVLCDKCSDDRKDKPILGMTILRNVKQNADDKAVWDGGEILDPNNGKTYKVRLKPMDGGKTLEVRGYIGPFYRNQTWLRVE